MSDPIQVRWTEPAARDLEEISEYLRRNSPAAARRVAQSLFEVANSLSLLPGRGRSGRIPGTRELIVPGLLFIIVYRLTSTIVHILRLYHGARDWPERQ